MTRSEIFRESQSPQETEAIGRNLAGNLESGEVLLLFGDIGAGKSVLTRGIIQALPGGEGRTVRSPTFVFIRHYPTRPPVHHIDLYRLPMGESPEEMGLDEWIGSGGVTIIEWAQRLSEWHFPKCTEIYIESLGGNRRQVRIVRR